MSSDIAELWRLPDHPAKQMDGSTTMLPRLAIRRGNWLGWYRVLPDDGGSINTIPDGSTLLILNDKWIDR